MGFRAVPPELGECRERRIRLRRHDLRENAQFPEWETVWELAIRKNTIIIIITPS